jgi:hypothetical protein
MGTSLQDPWMRIVRGVFVVCLHTPRSSGGVAGGRCTRRKTPLGETFRMKRHGFERASLICLRTFPWGIGAVAAVGRAA